MNPLVSIGLQFYNNERTLSVAIESILQQTYDNFELILHNDGSTDGSLNVAKHFKDSRIRLYDDSTNRKRPYRLNESIDSAKGKYYAVMDGDDISYKHRIEEQVMFMESHPSVDIVGGSMLVFKGDGLPIGKRVNPSTHEKIIRAPYQGFPLAQPTFMGKTEWFRRFKYSNEITLSEDYDILLRSFTTSKFANISKIVLAYREETISIERIKELRQNQLISAMRYYLRRKRLDICLMAALVQSGKRILDEVAVKTNLGYNLLLQRAKILTRSELEDWSEFKRQIACRPQGEENTESLRIDTGRPLVSVGLQFYNNERTLERAIKSILNQTYRNLELILYDDGSTDESYTIAEQFTDPRIRLYRNSSNKKRSFCLNHSIDLARGEYFAIVDGDDYSYTDRLEKQVEFLKKNHDIDLVGGGMIVIDVDGGIIGKRIHPANHKEICKKPWAGIPISQPTFMGRTSWFRTYYYDPMAVRAQDQDLLLRAFGESHFANLNSIIVAYEEKRLSVKKLLYERLHYSKILLCRYTKERKGATLVLAIVLQCLKAVIDTLAILTKVNYKLLRHRASPVNIDDLSMWAVQKNRMKDY